MTPNRIIDYLDDVMVVLPSEQQKAFEAWLPAGFPGAEQHDNQDTTVHWDLPSDAAVLAFKIRWEKIIMQWDGSPPRFKGLRVSFGSIAVRDERKIAKWVKQTCDGAVLSYTVALYAEMRETDIPAFRAAVKAQFPAARVVG